MIKSDQNHLHCTIHIDLYVEMVSCTSSCMSNRHGDNSNVATATAASAISLQKWNECKCKQFKWTFQKSKRTKTKTHTHTHTYSVQAFCVWYKTNISIVTTSCETSHYNVLKSRYLSSKLVLAHIDRHHVRDSIKKASYFCWHRKRIVFVICCVFACYVLITLKSM